jgi:hypothetical protein
MRTWMIAVSLTAACGGVPGPTAEWIGPDGTPPVMADVVARPGEAMVYQVELHGLAVAEFTVTVGATTSLDDVAVVPISARVVSSPLLTMFHPVDDTLATWIDPRNGHPVAFEAHELASSRSTEVEHTRVRYAPDQFAVVVERAGQRFDEVQVVRHDTFDVPSMLTWLRGWSGAVGERVVVDVMRSRTAWRLAVAVAGRESVATVLGPMAAVRYEGASVRMRRDGADDTASERRGFTLWISDDADRVPLRLRARTDYGDIEMALVDYRAP